MGSYLIHKIPQIVEFLGLPGSGKTTIANSLSVNYVKSCDVDEDSKAIRLTISPNGWGDKEKKLKSFFLMLMKLLLGLIWAVIHPKLLTTIVKENFLFSNQPKLIALKRIMQFYNCLSYLSWIKIYRKLISLPVDYILIEEGVLQAILSLDLGHDRVNTTIINYIYLPEIIIYFDVSSEIAFQRVFLRKTSASRLDRMDNVTAHDMMIKLKNIFNTFINALQSLNKSKIFIIQNTNDDTPEDVAGNIAKLLKND